MARKKIDSLEQFNQEALDAGMSYGKYQVMETCKLLKRGGIVQKHIETPDERVARLYENKSDKGIYGENNWHGRTTKGD